MIEVDADLTFTVGGEVVHSNVDLVVRVQGKRFMVLSKMRARISGVEAKRKRCHRARIQWLVP